MNIDFENANKIIKEISFMISSVKNVTAQVPPWAVLVDYFPVGGSPAI